MNIKEYILEKQIKYCEKCNLASYDNGGLYCESKGVYVIFLNTLCKGDKIKKERPYFSFNKISLIKGKKYKNKFERKIVEVFYGNKGEEYLVDKRGCVYKEYDELGD